MLETHMNTEAIVADMNTEGLCVYSQWKHVEACNPQNIKTRATGGHTNGKENCVCLC